MVDKTNKQQTGWNVINRQEANPNKQVNAPKRETTDDSNKAQAAPRSGKNINKNK